MARDYGPDVCACKEIADIWQKKHFQLVRTAKHLTSGCHSDAEDLLSRALIKVLNYRQNGAEIENFVGLLLTALKQVHIDTGLSRRERVLRDARTFEDGHDGAFADLLVGACEDAIFAKEILRDVLDVIADLPPTYQDIFELRFIHELSFSEISNSMGMSEANARQKVSQLRKRLSPLREEFFG